MTLHSGRTWRDPVHLGEEEARAQPLVRKPISLSVVFGASGQWVRMDDLTRRATIRASEPRMLVPRIVEPSRAICLNFLWGRSRSALGIRRSSGPAGRYVVDHEAFADFSGLHRRVLADTSDLALGGFLKFLDRWPSVLAAALPPFCERLAPNVVFRFQYDDDFLHNRPAAREICKQLAEGPGTWDPPLTPGHGSGAPRELT